MQPPTTVADAQRDDPALTPADLISAYEQGVEELRLAVAWMTAEQLRSRPVAGKWSTLEVVCHVADCEQFFADRMKRVLAEDRPALPFADPDRYMAALACAERDALEEVAFIGLLRRQMARILRRLPDAAAGRVGIHSERGERTLADLVAGATGHIAHHVPFIAEKRRALGSAK